MARTPNWGERIKGIRRNVLDDVGSRKERRGYSGQRAHIVSIAQTVERDKRTELGT